MLPFLKYLGIGLAAIVGIIAIFVMAETAIYILTHLVQLIGECAGVAAKVTVFLIVWTISIGIILLGFLVTGMLVVWVGARVVDQIKILLEKLRTMISKEFASGAIDATAIAFLAAIVALVAFIAPPDFLDHQGLINITAALAISVAACKILMFFHHRLLTLISWIASCLLGIGALYLISARFGLWDYGFSMMWKSIFKHWYHFGAGRQVVSGVLIVITGVIYFLPFPETLRLFQKIRHTAVRSAA